MFSLSLFLQNGISPGILDKARSLSAYLAKRHFTRHTWQTCSLLQTGIHPESMLSFSLSCKTAFHQAYLTKHVLFQLGFAKRHFTGHTWQRWQNMFSFSLFLENGISPGVLDKACSLSIFHQADLTKHVLFRLVFAQRHFTRHTWQKLQSMFSFSFFLQNGISPGTLDKIWQSMLSFSLFFAKRHFSRQTWQSMFSFSLVLQNGISPGRLDKACSLSVFFLQNGISLGLLDKNDKACSLSVSFCKTAFPQAYLTKFDKACSLSACFLQNGISPGRLDKACSLSAFFLQNGISLGLLDKDDKACSLSACFCTTAFYQAYLTKITKHVLFQLIFENGISPGIVDKNMFSFSLLLQKDISLGLLDKQVLFQHVFANGIPSGILDKACSLLAWFCKTALHQAYLKTLTKHVLFQLVFGKLHFTRHTWQSIKGTGKSLGRVWEG